MTPAGLPPEHLPSEWHRRFPDLKHIWVGRLRLWYVELPTRPPPSSNGLSEWIGKATADGASPSAAARRLGLPAAVVAALHPDAQPAREEFAFLDLPAGPFRVPPASGSFEPWPEPVGEVPQAVLRPAGVEVVPMTGNWRTVPVVRAAAVDVVVVWLTDRIEVFAAGDPGGPALWRLPADLTTGL